MSTDERFYVSLITFKSENGLDLTAFLVLRDIYILCQNVICGNVVTNDVVLCPVSCTSDKRSKEAKSINP